VNLNITNLAEKAAVELVPAGSSHLQVQVGLISMVTSILKSRRQVVMEVAVVLTHMCSHGLATLAELYMDLLLTMKPCLVQVPKDIRIAVLLDVYLRVQDWRGS
jgi:hypothetical protein